ncbi:uncharacterized protein LOC141649858 [Silene latifolia]|uniref:uncharacterized protein LOC141649858 n=1 Tax=Silene latifolia TaxID=37657 RepID=UPI003D7715EE
MSLPKSAGGLGMRNIECLNQALLAKHAWRIVSGQDSLFCKVFRARLFGRKGMNPELDYKRSGNVSWGMRSIRVGMELIKRNVAWKPGIYSRLNVWSTCWVNGDMPEPSVEALHIENMGLKDLRIADLYSASGGWDEERVRHIFDEGVVDHVLAIPVYASQAQDRIFWKHTTNGEYSVKSGYGVAFNHFMLKHASVKDKTRMSEKSISFCRKFMWKLHVPQKWKVFLWRLISDALPTGSGLDKRGIHVDSSCKVCMDGQEFMETRAHLFRDCSVAKRVWACLDLGIRVNCDPSMDVATWVINWVSYICKLEGAEVKLIKFVGILWCLWVVRNRVVFRGGSFHPQMFYGIWTTMVGTVVKAREEGEKSWVERKEGGGAMLCVANDLRDGYPFYVVGAANSCTPVKVGVDAGWKSVKEAAIGWVAYAADGSKICSRGNKVKAQSAMQAEAIGLRDVLLWASAQGIQHLDVSSDCLKLLLQISGGKMIHHLTRGLLDDMSVLFPSFHCLSFSFVPRCFNKIAHGLAQRAMRGS